MIPGWVCRFPITQLAPALPLRLQPGIDAKIDSDFLWLRGVGPVSDSLLASLRLIPAAERFTFDKNGLLTPENARLPVGPLPDGSWTPLAELIRLRLSPPALAASVGDRAEITIVRAAVELASGAMLTTIDLFKAWATTAPKVRLDRLRFSIRIDGTALILGRPIPPIHGTELVHRDGILVPAGFTWHPPIDTATLRQVLGLSPGDVALFDPDGTHQLIRGEMLVPATRAGVRRSK